MENIRELDRTIENIMTPVLKKPSFVKGALHLVLILYAAYVAPKPPKVVLDLFENQYFKLFFFALILWTAQFTPATSLLIAISFLITMNYINKKALWEFMENVDNAGQPVAPSKEVALNTSAAVLENQMEKPQVVDSVTAEQETVVIQPTVVQTPEGKQTVQMPSVVVAPAMVANEKGEAVLVKPDVTVLNVPEAPPAPAAPIQEAAPAPTPEAAVPAPEAVPEQGCYPIRKYDMTKVSGYSLNDFYGSI